MSEQWLEEVCHLQFASVRKPIPSFTAISYVDRLTSVGIVCRRIPLQGGLSSIRFIFGRVGRGKKSVDVDCGT